MPDPQEFITRAPHDLAGWVALFDPATLPVLADTAQALEELREAEDAVDAHRLGEALVDDPLMTIKLLAHLARLRRIDAELRPPALAEGAGARPAPEDVEDLRALGYL